MIEMRIMRRPVLHFYNLSPTLLAFSSTRHGGVSTGSYGEFNINHFCGDDEAHLGANLQALAEELGVDARHIVMPHQVHDVKCRLVDPMLIAADEKERARMLDGYDAVMTQLKGVCIGVSTADCIPVLLYDEPRQAVCAIHAGWRGTCARIVEKAVAEMQRCFGTHPQDLQAVIGPGISLDNFEVGQEVYDEFRRAGHDMSRIARRMTKWHIDLPHCNELQLVRTGVPQGRIYQSGICTWNQVDDYFSARRLGQQSGRIFTAIMLR